MADKPSDVGSRKALSPFWFMNHFGNPLVGLILSSPLHPLLSQSLLVLSYRGRKSGKRFDIPVEYAQSGETLCILPGRPEQKTWWRNFRGGTPVDILLRGHRLHGLASLLDGREDAFALAQALAIYLRRFPASSASFGVHPDPEGKFESAELSRVAKCLVIVRVQVEGAAVY
ncbi:MAG: hypothetical protein ABSG98_10725 [Anaerolineales bacterium]|jgi:hypothetical protein